MNTTKVPIIVLDASGMSLGRLATMIAHRLQGKHRVDFQRNVDANDLVRVEHVERMRFTGKKLTDKVYRRYSGYQGGLKSEALKDVIAQKGHAEVLRRAVKRMLPNNRLRAARMGRLEILS